MLSQELMTIQVEMAAQKASKVGGGGGRLAAAFEVMDEVLGGRMRLSCLRVLKSVVSR